MRTCSHLLIAGAVIMAAVIVYGFVAGQFMQEASVLFPLPWFQVTLADLYLGFALFGGWIFYRESSRGTATLWLISLCLLGNLAACLYAGIAMRRCQGNWRQFWIGRE